MPKSPRNISSFAIRKYRERLGWTQSDLAAKCQIAGWDISRDIIARIEGRTRLVRDVELARIASVLGVTPNDLLASFDKKKG